MQAANIWDWPLTHEDGMVNVVNDENRFEADLDVPTFRENEIDVSSLFISCTLETIQLNYVYEVQFDRSLW